MKNARASNSDILSNLPANVIEHILTCLPIQDAARTSVLSSQWRYKWLHIPELVFDYTFCRSASKKNTSARNKVLMTLYQVLLFRLGPVARFTLSIPGLESCLEIDHIILFALRNGVQELTLHLWRGDHHCLPPSLYSYSQLSYLSLRSCVFEPPSMFKGFGRLTCLELSEVIITADAFACVVRSNPGLERVSLESPCNLDYLEICGPNLKCVSFKTLFKSVRSVNAPLLEALSISLPVSEDEEDSMGGSGVMWGSGVTDSMGGSGVTHSMIELIGSLPVIEELHMDCHYLKGLMYGGIPISLNCLKRLGLSDICFKESSEVLHVLSMIRNCPKLRKISIESVFHPCQYTSYFCATEEFFEEHGGSMNLDELREVEIRFIFGPELEFIKFLLAKASMLEMMLIAPDKIKVSDKGMSLLKEVTRFRRASTKAEIIFEYDRKIKKV